MINEEAKIFFDNFTQRHVTEYKNHFQQRLAAVYVCGSVHRGEAVPGVSDVDIHPFITDELNEADWKWYRLAEEKFDREFLGVHGLCTPDPVDHLVFFPIRHGKYTTDEDARIRAQSLVHRMRYDGTLVWGNNITEGLDVPPLDREWARGYFTSVRDLARYAAGLETENKTDFRLPRDASHRLRKLARLAVLGGAYLLMGRGEFRSFRGVEVLPPLKGQFPQWTPFLEETEKLYIPINEATTEEDVADYLSRLAPWVDWIREQLK